MTELRRAEATAGLMAHILFGATVAILFLVGALAIEFIPTFEDGPLRGALQDGRALPAYYYTAMVLLGGFALWVAWEMGRTSARTGSPVRGQAAMGVLFGAAVAWVNIILAMLFVVTVTAGDFEAAVELALEGLVFLSLGILPVVVVAVFAATFARDHYAALPGAALPVTAADVRAATSEDWPFPAQPTATASLAVLPSVQVAGFQIDCPRCGIGFSVARLRPQRIACPECGKAGTIR